MARQDWTPSEVRKLIALLAGIGFGIAGVTLMVSEVQGGGTINISSSILSGEIESGSAGILLTFLAVFVVVLSSWGGRRDAPATPATPVADYTPANDSDEIQPSRLAALVGKPSLGVRRGAVAVVSGWIVVALASAINSIFFRDATTSNGFEIIASVLGLFTGLGTLLLAVVWVAEVWSER